MVNNQLKVKESKKIYKIENEKRKKNERGIIFKKLKIRVTLGIFVNRYKQQRFGVMKQKITWEKEYEHSKKP